MVVQTTAEEIIQFQNYSDLFCIMGTKIIVQLRIAFTIFKSCQVKIGCYDSLPFC